jgi:hypothetical protein
LPSSSPSSPSLSSSGPSSASSGGKRPLLLGTSSVCPVSSQTSLGRAWGSTDRIIAALLLMMAICIS